MGLPVYKTFTEEQLKNYKRYAGPVDEFATKIRVYQTPFMYDNVEVGDFYEIDVMKGIEFKADTGFYADRFAERRIYPHKRLFLQCKSIGAASCIFCKNDYAVFRGKIEKS